MARERQPIKHGTLYGYRGRGCRCEACVAAFRTKWREYGKQYYRRRYRRSAAARREHSKRDKKWREEHPDQAAASYAAYLQMDDNEWPPELERQQREDMDWITRMLGSGQVIYARLPLPGEETNDWLLGLKIEEQRERDEKNPKRKKKTKPLIVSHQAAVPEPVLIPPRRVDPRPIWLQPPKPEPPPETYLYQVRLSRNQFDLGVGEFIDLLDRVAKRMTDEILDAYIDHGRT